MGVETITFDIKYIQESHIGSAEKTLQVIRNYRSSIGFIRENKLDRSRTIYLKEVSALFSRR